jgi:hypothetical protein
MTDLQRSDAYRWTIFLGLAGGCALGAAVHVDDTPLEPWRQEGLSIAVPAGARVVAEPGTVQVDAADGARWFDLRWVEPPRSPEAEVYEWTRRTCTTVRWDRTATPVPGTTTTGGLCSINDRRHWAFTSIEQRPDGALVTLYVADARRVPFEDAWVDLVLTALSASAGAEPLAPLPRDELRRQIRETAASGGLGEEPVPGGGELSAAVSERLRLIWEARSQRPLPRP